MAARDTGTEQLIKDTAKRIFLSEGKLHATTQDIADAAGVNRTLVHYYFRSRDILFDHVVAEAKHDLKTILDSVLTDKIDFKQKVKKLIDVFIDETINFPFRELFIITESNRSNDIPIDKADHIHIKTFLGEVKLEMEKGTIKTIDVRQWMMNLFSLMAYPVLSAPLNKSFLKINDAEFNKLMKQRKQIIFEMIFPDE